MELPMKLGIAGGTVCFVAITFEWFAFPTILKSQIHGQTALRAGGEMREMWSKLPFPLEFKIYIFNITNPEGIQNGEKPIVREIGPYYYDEWKEKVNLVDRDEDDTVEYNQRVTWRFNPSKSNGLTGDEELIYPHLAMLGMIMLTVADKPTMIGVATKAVDSIYKKPTSIFVKVTAKEILFDGQSIDCTVKDFAGSAVCSMLKTQAKDLVVVGDDMYKFSLFGHKNGTVAQEKIRVYRGIKRASDVGRVLEWNNQSALTIWSGDHCNAYNGTDSTIFHPFLYKNEDVVSFTPDVCRSLSARYQRPSKVKGIRTNRYTADIGDQSTVPEEKCFCPTPETCLKKGAMDLTKCVGTPIVATLPHFYLTDRSYLETISGLHPVQVYREFHVKPNTFQIRRQRAQFLQVGQRRVYSTNFAHAQLTVRFHLEFAVYVWIFNCHSDNTRRYPRKHCTRHMEDHEISIDFEPITGTPLIARKRMQFNMFVFSIPKFKLMKNFPSALLPLFWIEEGVELGDDIINRLKSALRMITVARCVIKWIMLSLGIGLCGVAGGLGFKRRQARKKLEITPVSGASAPLDSFETSGSGNKEWPIAVSTLHPAAVPPTLIVNTN